MHYCSVLGNTAIIDKAEHLIQTSPATHCHSHCLQSNSETGHPHHLQMGVTALLSCCAPSSASTCFHPCCVQTPVPTCPLSPSCSNEHDHSEHLSTTSIENKLPCACLKTALITKTSRFLMGKLQYVHHLSHCILPQCCLEYICWTSAVSTPDERNGFVVI